MIDFSGASVPENYIPDEIQLVQLGLLKEIDSICKKERINYSIAGRLAIDYLKNKKITAPYYDFKVAMRPSDIKTFLDVVSRLKMKNRALEGVFNNLFYPDKTVRYIATNTTYFNPLENLYKYNSIFITIIPLTPVSERSTYPKVAKLKQICAKLVLYSRHLPLGLHNIFYPFAILSGLSLRNDIKNDTRFDQQHNSPIFAANSIVNQNTNSVLASRTKEVKFQGVKLRIYTDLANSPRSYIPYLNYLEVAPSNYWAIIMSARVAYREYKKQISILDLLKLRIAHLRERRYLGIIAGLESGEYTYPKCLLPVAFNFYMFKYKKMLKNNSSENFDSYMEYFVYFFRKNMLLIPDVEKIPEIVEYLEKNKNDEIAQMVKDKLRNYTH